MDIQWIIVTAIIAISVVFIVSRICRTIQGKNACGCGCQAGNNNACTGCPCRKKEETANDLQKS